MTSTQTNPSRLHDQEPDRRLRRSRRRFARRHWRRRWLALRYVALTVLLVALVTFALWAVYLSSWLSVTGADVSGARSLSVKQVRAVADVPVGKPLVSADLAGIRNRLQALAQVKSADVSREWPHQIKIVLTERVAVAAVEIGGTFHAMDADGVVFATYAKAPRGLPLVRADGADVDARKEAAAVIASLPPALTTQVDHVEVDTVDGVSLLLRDGTHVVWGSSAQSEDKARVLSLLLGRGKTIDVSVPGRPTTSP